MEGPTADFILSNTIIQLPSFSSHNVTHTPGATMFLYHAHYSLHPFRTLIENCHKASEEERKEDHNEEKTVNIQ